MDAKGTVWVGANGDFGSLVPEVNGTLRYLSLLEKTLPEDSNFTAAYVTPTAQGVFFRSLTRLFLWDGRKLQVWRPKRGVQRVSEGHGRIYMSELGVGLQEFVGGRWVPAPGGEALGEAVIVTMHPWDESHSLITTRSSLLWLYDGRSLQPFHTEADAYLKSNEAYTSIHLADGGFCITTILVGDVILEHDGRLRRILDKNSGLPGPGVYEAFEDSDGVLWLGQGASLSRVELNTPITEVTRHFGSTLARFQGGLYLGSSAGGAGLHRLIPEASTGVPILKTLAAPVSQAFELMVFRDPAGGRDQLLGATGNGLIRIEGDKVTPLMPGGYSSLNSSYIMLQSTRVPNRLYYALSNSGGLLAYRWDGARWAEEARRTLIPGIRYLVEEEDGSLWAGGQGGVVRIDKAANNFQGAKTETFGAENGLPGGGSYALKRVGGQIIATPGNYAGMFRWDSTAHKFIPDDRFFLKADSISGGNVWEQPTFGSNPMETCGHRPAQAGSGASVSSIAGGTAGTPWTRTQSGGSRRLR